MKDITTIIPSRGGAVPEVWEALAAAGINIEAAVSFAREHHRVVHVVVASAVAAEAERVLTVAGFFLVDIREVLVVPVEDQPGGLAKVTRTATENGIEVYLLAMATGNRVLLGVVDFEAASAVFNA